MAEIVHHTDESAAGGESPFDVAIQEIVAGEDVLVACPYITLEYLEPVLGSASSWRLLTDVEAWLGNYGTNERNTIREFIAHYHDRIHDVRNLHAKAVVGETGALVGSANLTWTGLQGRDELGVRLNELKRIEELREWFDGRGLRARQRSSMTSTNMLRAPRPCQAARNTAAKP
jgi:phosphatidylserine/phosphatidylglycerophosphate/cardiolipin synthase-like enzyme